MKREKLLWGIVLALIMPLFILSACDEEVEDEIPKQICFICHCNSNAVSASFYLFPIGYEYDTIEITPMKELVNNTKAPMAKAKTKSGEIIETCYNFSIGCENDMLSNYTGKIPYGEYFCVCKPLWRLGTMGKKITYSKEQACYVDPQVNGIKYDYKGSIDGIYAILPWVENK